MLAERIGVKAVGYPCSRATVVLNIDNTGSGKEEGRAELAGHTYGAMSHISPFTIGQHSEVRNLKHMFSLIHVGSERIRAKEIRRTQI